ncbi:MAG: ABC transporter substrate-binding protein [Candidatus Omnitrophota bacterium]
MVRKLFVLGLAILVLGLYFPSGADAQGKINIGVLKFVDETRYVEAVKGFTDDLKKQGYDENNVDFDIRSAEGNNEKAGQIAKEFVDKKVNLILAIGTGGGIAAFKATKEIPIVGTIIFSYVGIGLAKSNASSGTNVTGSTTAVDAYSMIKILRQVSPAKRIGVLYCESEKNTVLQLEELKKLKSTLGYTVVEANVSKAEEAVQAVTDLVNQRVDSIVLTGSTTISNKVMPDIVEVTNKAKVPIFSHTSDRVKNGALLSISAEPYKLGELAGKKAVQVLKGAKPSDIPIESLTFYDITINASTAKAIGLVIPAKLLESAKQVIK